MWPLSAVICMIAGIVFIAVLALAVIDDYQNRNNQRDAWEL